MNELARILESAEGQWLPASLLRASIQGGAALAFAWLLCRFLPKLPPAWKSWQLRLAYLKLLVAFCWATPIDLPLLRPEPPTEPLRTMVIDPLDHGPMPVATPVETPIDWRTGLAPVVLAVWIAGAATSIVIVAMRWRAAVRLRRRSSALADPSLLCRYEQLAMAMGVRRPPPLLTLDLAAGPLLVGLLRPAVVVPARLIGSDAARLRLMLAHELAHHRRRDLPWGLLPMLARILFWFHPVVWLAEREWWLARESACDALAVRATGASAAEYGGALLDAATWAGGAVSRFATAGVIESKSTLKRRLSAMQTLPLASRRRWAVIGSTMVLASALALVPLRLTAQPANNPTTGAPSSPGAAPGVAGAPATESAWRGALKFSGTVEGNTAQVRPAIDGVITAVKCDLGQAVKPGDLLFELDSRVAAAQLAAAEAQLELAKARVQEANAGAKTGTAGSGNLREARAQLEVAEAEIEVRRLALSQTRVFAPFGGVIARRDANVGDVVKRGEALATLVQLNPLTISVSVSQGDYPRVQVGQEVRVNRNGQGHQVIAGKVSFIAPQLDPATGTGIVNVAVSNADGRLKPGMFVTVEILVAPAPSEPAK